jgi:hypothetical protein
MRGNSAEARPDTPIISFGIGCCLLAIAVVVAFALANHLPF